jgi:uncharacterized membrane protein
MIENIWLVAFLNLLPTTEQIGGITVGLSLGLNPLLVLLVSLTINCLLFFPVYFGLEAFYERVSRKIKLLKRYLERTRKKGKPYVDKYGMLGLTLFIALPTPLTGTYTASALSWFLGLDWKRSFLAIVLGSSIGALIIFSSYFGVFYALKALIGV